MCMCMYVMEIPRKIVSVKLCTNRSGVFRCNENKMNFALVLTHLRQTKKILVPGIQHVTQTCQYAAPGGVLAKMKKGKKGAPVNTKVEIPVETDVKRLLTFVCGTNILKEGGQDVEIKADSEYPDWLWKIRTGPPPKLEDLDPNTKAYWRKLRKQTLRHKNLQHSYKRF